MPQFKYSAKGPDGKIKSGTIQVPTSLEATRELKKQGLTIISLKEISKEKVSLRIFQPRAGQKVKADQLAVFTRQLATMINAGIPLVEALEVLQEQAESESFRLTLKEIVQKVRGGTDLSAALADYPKIFSRIYVSMVRAGEAGGQLDVILNRLAEYIEKARALKRDITSAMVYPVISLSLIIIIVTGLMIFIVPKFEKIFEALGGQLPLPTRILLKISALMQSYWYLGLGGVIALIVGISIFRRIPTGEYALHWLYLRLPIIGDLFQKVAISRFCRTLGTLIQSGVPILGALEIVATTAGNRIIENAINESRENVRKGETLSEPLSRSGIFPPMVTRMISVGEKSGALESLLEKISEFYDQEVKAAVESLTSMIEPMMIGVMGILVGGIVLAIFLPIFGIQKMLMKQ